MSSTEQIEILDNKLFFKNPNIDVLNITLLGIKIGDSFEKFNSILENLKIDHFKLEKNTEFVIRLKGYGAGVKFENNVVTGLYFVIKEFKFTNSQMRKIFGGDYIKTTFCGDMFDDDNPWYRDASDDVYSYQEKKIRFKKFYSHVYLRSIHLGYYKNEEDD